MKRTIATILIPSFLLFSCWKDEVITATDETTLKYVSVEKIKPKYFSEELKISWKVSS